MEGRNEIQLNQATMIKAVEHYLNDELFIGRAQIRVISVAPSEGQQQGRTYRIIFEPKPKPNKQED